MNENRKLTKLVWMYVKVGVTEAFDGPPFECALFVCIMVG